jgi:FdhD protein
MYKRKVTIIRIKDNKKLEVVDEVVVEESVDICVNSEPLVSILCLSTDLKELAIGFLYSVGIINSFEDINDIELKKSPLQVNIKLKNKPHMTPSDLQIAPISRVIETASGITSPWRVTIQKALGERSDMMTTSYKNLQIGAKKIYSAIKIMQNRTSLYKKTGGCHGAAIYDLKGNLFSLKEDIGRHNAIDKVIGDALQQNIPFKTSILTSTGRLTGDTVLKAVSAQFPIVASVSAAIDSGIRLAKAYDITLIGFVREDRMNIYTHPDRIVL